MFFAFSLPTKAISRLNYIPRKKPCSTVSWTLAYSPLTKVNSISSCITARVSLIFNSLQETFESTLKDVLDEEEKLIDIHLTHLASTG